MPDYRRSYVPGGTYFFTVVTHRRRPILTTAHGRASLGHALRTVRAARPFDLGAICVLPDHLHAVWTLPDGDSDFSSRWAAIKSLCSRRFRDLSRVGPRQLGPWDETAIWQDRFWEHTIRNGEDLRRHLDYVHYNPVKHGYAARPRDWPWSSFHRYVRQGWYDPRWGESEPAGLCPEPGADE
jgi:putative transposase